MAYSALVSLAQLLEQILPHHQDYTYLAEKEQFQTLHSHVIFLQELLEHFPGERSSMIKQLERRITDVAYHTEDIIASEISDRTACDEVAEKEANILSLRKMFSTLESCVEEFDSIVEDATEIRKILEKKKDMAGQEALAETSSPIGAPTFKDVKVGLDSDLKRINERLVGRDLQLQIIPIVGMGGIGKTTLARTMYEDPVVLSHFDIRIWVTISQDYSKHRILQAILSVSDPNAKNVEKEVLIELVYKSLVSRRFLIVFDDMWDAKAWDSVMIALPKDKQRSRVILTTRLSEVAVKVDSSCILHQMDLLDEDQSWALFQKSVFGQQPCPPQLEKPGKTIAENCKGLPLAIVVIAGVLKLNQSQYYWEIYANSIKEAAALTHDEQLLGILSLSYDNLPHHLKACFLYMSLFPEDDEIPIKKLVWILVAEGFLTPKRDKSMEEIAEECLVDLVERNLITIRKKRSNGRIRTCSIHDVLRELSLRKSKEEKFRRHDVRKNKNVSSILNVFHQCYGFMLGHKFNSPMVYLRRLALHNGAIFPSTQTNVYYEPLRSLLITHCENLQVPPFRKFKLLRVLDALQLTFSIRDDKMFCSLVHLRYLALTCRCCQFEGGRSWYDAHPELDLKFILNLKSLETLIVQHECYISEYGFEVTIPIMELPNLRHFVLVWNYSWRSTYTGPDPSYYWYYRINEPGPGICLASKLQTISGVNNLKLTSQMVQSMENLVKLKIRYTNVDLNECCFDQLVRLHKLEELSLKFLHHEARPIRLPRNIAIPDGLKKLTLIDLTISWGEMSYISSLRNLEVLKVEGKWHASSEWEPVDDEVFRILKYLKLELRQLENLRIESTNFPRLEQIVISGCLELKEVPMEVGEIETLRKLVIEGPSQICLGDSATAIHEQQQSYGNNDLQVFVHGKRIGVE